MSFAATPQLDAYKGIKQEKLPRRWFNYYVIYQYEDKSVNWETDEYIVGFDTIEAADEFADSLKEMANKISGKRVGCQTAAKSVAIVDHFPRRLLE